jgi:hypothetical protein
MNNLTKSLPQLAFIKRLVTDNRPKKLSDDNNSLKGNAETSLPLTEVRLANSKTGLSIAIIDLDMLISIPNPLQRAK